MTDRRGIERLRRAAARGGIPEALALYDALRDAGALPRTPSADLCRGLMPWNPDLRSTIRHEPEEMYGPEFQQNSLLWCQKAIFALSVARGGEIRERVFATHDGSFFRGHLPAYASEQAFPDAARIASDWHDGGLSGTVTVYDAFVPVEDRVHRLLLIDGTDADEAGLEGWTAPVPVLDRHDSDASRRLAGLVGSWRAGGLGTRMNPDDVDALVRRAERGDKDALRRLAERARGGASKPADATVWVAWCDVMSSNRRGAKIERSEVYGVYSTEQGGWERVLAEMTRSHHVYFIIEEAKATGDFRSAAQKWTDVTTASTERFGVTQHRLDDIGRVLPSWRQEPSRPARRGPVAEPPFFISPELERVFFAEIGNEDVGGRSRSGGPSAGGANPATLGSVLDSVEHGLEIRHLDMDGIAEELRALMAQHGPETSVRDLMEDPPPP